MIFSLKVSFSLANISLFPPLVFRYVTGLMAAFYMEITNNLNEAEFTLKFN
jgi:hypothetical protein